MQLTLVRAHPAGNTTLLVRGDVAPHRRAGVAAQLMQNPLFSAEQVGFIVSPCMGGQGRLEMMGGEFCGNAARSFGLWLARQGVGRAGEVWVEMSGCSRPVAVRADVSGGRAGAQMPLPVAVSDISLAGAGCVRVDFEGITHLVVGRQTPDERLIEAAAALFAREREVCAWGVLFLDKARRFMTPVVTVRAMGTPIWESSCGSGSVAAAAALSRGMDSGRATFAIKQPGGVILAQVEKRAQGLSEAWIDGGVAIDPPVAVRI
jgi:diaminopimelate epimerase